MYKIIATLHRELAPPVLKGQPHSSLTQEELAAKDLRLKSWALCRYPSATREESETLYKLLSTTPNSSWTIEQDPYLFEETILLFILRKFF